MENNIFFGGEDVVLTVKKGATERQIEILKKMHPGATITVRNALRSLKNTEDQETEVYNRKGELV